MLFVFWFAAVVVYSAVKAVRVEEEDFVRGGYGGPTEKDRENARNVDMPRSLFSVCTLFFLECVVTYNGGDPNILFWCPCLVIFYIDPYFLDGVR